MKLCIILAFAILLSGCSLNEGTETLYRQENVLQIEIVLPTEIDVKKNYQFQAIFTEQDNKMPNLEAITFAIWKNGKKNEKEIIPTYEGNGTYTINAIFEEEGLYFVKVEAKTKDSRVMPTKRFTVGSISSKDIDTLPEQNNEHHHEGHH